MNALRISRLEPNSLTGLMPMPELIEKLGAHLVLQEAFNFHRLRRASLVLDAGIHILGVLAKDHHIHQLGVTQRAGHTGEPTDRPDAGVQIEILAQRHVQAAEAAADRGGQRAFDSHQEFTNGVQAFSGEVVAAVQPGCLLPA